MASHRPQALRPPGRHCAVSSRPPTFSSDLSSSPAPFPHYPGPIADRQQLRGAPNVISVAPDRESRVAPYSIRFSRLPDPAPKHDSRGGRAHAHSAQRHSDSGVRQVVPGNARRESRTAVFRWAEYTGPVVQCPWPTTVPTTTPHNAPTPARHCDPHRKKFETLGPLVRAFSRYRVGSVPSAPPPRADLTRASANSPPSPRPALISGFRRLRTPGPGFPASVSAFRSVNIGHIQPHPHSPPLHRDAARIFHRNSERFAVSSSHQLDAVDQGRSA